MAAEVAAEAKSALGSRRQQAGAGVEAEVVPFYSNNEDFFKYVNRIDIDLAYVFR